MERGASKGGWSMRTRGIGLALLLVLAFPVSALAFVPRGGNTVVVAEPIRDDLYVGGGTVEVTGEVDGDIAAAGGTVMLSGPVSGGVMAMGGNIGIRGTVGRTIRAAGGTVAVGGRVAADAVLAGGSVTLERTAEVGRDLVATGGRVYASGTVRRNAWLTGGTVTITGTVEGDVEAHADRIVLTPTARVNGTFRYSAENPIEIQSGAQVAGQVTRVERPSRSRVVMKPSARLGFRFAGRLLEALWLLAIGFVLLAIAPRAVDRVKEQVGVRFWLSLLAGFILVVVVPVAAVLLLITIVGIPLAAAVVLLYFATLYPGQVFVSAWLGDAVLRRLGRSQRAVSPYLALTLGAVVLVVLVALPFIGWIFRLLAVFAGFGAIWAAIWRVRTRQVPTVGAG